MNYHLLEKEAALIEYERQLFLKSYSTEICGTAINCPEAEELMKENKVDSPVIADILSSGGGRTNITQTLATMKLKLKHPWLRGIGVLKETRKLFPFNDIAIEYAGVFFIEILHRINSKMNNLSSSEEKYRI